MSDDRTDKLVVNVGDPELAETIRKRLMFTLKPAPSVFVVFNKMHPEYGFDITIANEWGGNPSPECMERCREIAGELVGSSSAGGTQ